MSEGLTFANESLVLIGVFLVVVMIVLGLYGLLSTDPAVRRLGAGANDAEGAAGHSIFYGKNESRLIRLLRPVQEALRRGESDKTRGVVRTRLAQAGFYNPQTDAFYYMIRIGLALALAAGAVPLAFGLIPSMPGNFLIFGTAFAAAAGYYLPALALNVIIEERQAKFRLGMPDALDMILIGIESGLSLPAALQKACEELGEAHPVVAEQFEIVVLEFQAGKSRGDALRSLARRVDVDEARTFATMITKSEALGTSLAQTLRVIAEEMRRDRLLKAEKKASELPVKMAFPLVLFIFPALFMTIMTPVLIRLGEAFDRAF